MAVRSVSHISNVASLFVDEWVTPGHPTVDVVESKGVTWYIVDGKIAVAPLRSVSANGSLRENPCVKILNENGFTTISTVIHRSEKDALVFSRYTECAWVIALIDSIDDVKKIEIKDVDILDRTVSRTKIFNKRSITVSNGRNTVNLSYDPYNLI